MLRVLGRPSSRALPTLACRCSISSKAKLQSPHDKKMEALVSLYHQSDTFITPENLSAAIDRAFTHPLNITDDQRKHSHKELVSMRKQRRESSKFSLGRDNGPLLAHSSETMGPGWTESKSKRVDQVYRALMGTQRSGRPSWLALRENSKKIEPRGGGRGRGDIETTSVLDEG